MQKDGGWQSDRPESSGSWHRGRIAGSGKETESMVRRLDKGRYLLGTGRSNLQGSQQKQFAKQRAGCR